MEENYKKDLLEIAIKGEEIFVEFYATMAERFDHDEEISSLYNKLSKFEEGHISVFQNIIDKTHEFEKIPNEKHHKHDYYTLLASHFRKIMISDAKQAAVLSKLDNHIDILDFAIKVEQNSISFYREIRQLFEPPLQEKIDQIIDQEKDHFLELANMRKNILKIDSL